MIKQCINLLLIYRDRQRDNSVTERDKTKKMSRLGA